MHKSWEDYAEMENLKALISLAAEQNVGKIGMIKVIRQGLGLDLVTSKRVVESNDHYAPFAERPKVEKNAFEFAKELGLDC